MNTKSYPFSPLSCIASTAAFPSTAHSLLHPNRRKNLLLSVRLSTSSSTRRICGGVVQRGVSCAGFFAEVEATAERRIGTCGCWAGGEGGAGDGGDRRSKFQVSLISGVLVPLVLELRTGDETESSPKDGDGLKDESISNEEAPQVSTGDGSVGGESAEEEGRTISSGCSTLA